MSIQTRIFAKQADQNPSYVMETIIENNPLGVAQNLKDYAGEVVDPGDTAAMMDVIAYVTSKSSQPGVLLYNILNTTIIVDNLTPVAQDWALEKMVQNQTRSMILPDTGLTQEEMDYIQNGVTSEATQTGSDINWGSVIADQLPSILSALGINAGTSGGGANNTTNTTPESSTNWTTIIIVVVILLILAIAIYKATRS